MKIKITGLDADFSNYIRWIRDKGICQRCFHQYFRPSRSLHNSHFWGRARKPTRFDPENCVAMCHGCHSFLTANPELHRAFFLKRLGQTRYDMLMLRANTNPHRPDYKAIEFWLKEEFRVAQFVP